MSLSQRERLERLPLKYELVVFDGRRELKRTLAIGEFTAVQVDAHHLAISLGGSRVEYTLLQQTTPAPPPNGPRWWDAMLGQTIARGVTYNLKLTRQANAPDALIEELAAR